MADAKPTFAPIPARAIADQSITSLDLRVLAALAIHDRLGRNGIGCYASHKRLAQLVGCHVKSLSRSLRDLGERGYIEGQQHPLMKKLRVYRVLYTADDLAIVKRPIGNEPATGDSTNGNEPVPSEQVIGNRDFREAECSHGVNEVEDILRSKGINLAEAIKKSGETASPCGDANFDAERDYLSHFDPDGRFLAQTERRFKELDREDLTAGEVSELRAWWERCEDIEERRACDRDTVHYWAQRLAGEIGWRVEQWQPPF